MPFLLDTFAREILKNKFDIVENTEVQKAARLYQQHCTSARSIPTKIVWPASKNLSALLFSSAHIAQSIFQLYFDMDLHEKTWDIPYTSWTNRWLARSNSFDVTALLAHECEIGGVAIKPSTTRHLSVGAGRFATQSFGNGQPVGHSYVISLYRAIYDGHKEHLTEK